MKSAVLEKILSRLDQIDPGEVQALLVRLVREKGFLQKVFEALQEGVLLLTSDFKISFINHAACQFFGLTAEHAQGQSLNQVIRGIDWTSLLNSPRRSINRDLEIFYPENRFLNFYCAPVADENEPDFGHVMLVRDLTHSRQEAQIQLESEKLNALTLLAAGVAHEIGNPLNSLSLHLQLLQRKLKNLHHNDQQSLAPHLNTAQAEIKRLDLILKQFLQAMRPTQPRREPANLHHLLDETLLSLQPEITSRQISVNLILADHLPTLQLDPVQIKQALYNLISNAYQAVDPSHGKITIHSQFTDYEVSLAISDNGCGISSEALGTMFEPFKTSKPNGNGLGLIIVRRIIREHGGEIEVESQESLGTKVTLFFPRHDQKVRLLEEKPTIEI